MPDKSVEIKRPINVDLDCSLRVIGQSRASFRFVSDEGDGYETYPGYMEGEGPDLKPHHFQEWAEQLGYAAEWCRRKADEISKKET
jgi:hypothetical protein